jgi:hypothetical protein
LLLLPHLAVPTLLPTVVAAAKEGSDPVIGLAALIEHEPLRGWRRQWQVVLRPRIRLIWGTHTISAPQWYYRDPTRPPPTELISPFFDGSPLTNPIAPLQMAWKLQTSVTTSESGEAGVILACEVEVDE